METVQDMGGKSSCGNSMARKALAILPWALFAAGSAYFAWGAWQVAFSPSMDYAVVVEMARNMASGADFPIFFYGQTYMGSLEPAASALLCFLFGPHPFCVCMGTALFGMAALFATMRLAHRLAGNAGAAFALVLAICGGPYWFHFMVSPRGGYSLATLLAILALGMGAIGEFEDGEGRVRPWLAALAGLLAGLAFWNFWLALPAFAAAGIVLLWRMGRRIFSWRFLVPAAIAFLAGSAPWWVWTLREGAGAFGSGEGPSPLKLLALKEIFLIVLPQFFCSTNEAGALWRGPLPPVLCALVAFASLAAIRAKGGLLRFFAATTLFSAFFVFAYCFTSFGAMHVARYFIILVPPWAVAGGAALASAMRGGQGSGTTKTAQALRIAAAALAAAYALLVAPKAIARSNALAADLKKGGATWSHALNAAAKSPKLEQPAFAEFNLFGANWVTDRRLCFISPVRWRYDPYLLKLEESDSPVVVSDFLDFSLFCKATGGKCHQKTIASFPVAYAIRPPAERRELATKSVADMMACGKSARSALLDDDLSTTAELGGGYGDSVEVVFDGPQEVCGVRGIVRQSSAIYGWRAEALDEAGGTWEVISQENPHRGWFWSGPRPYLFGPDSVWELRWSPRRISRMRIVFETREAKKASGAYALSLADLRPLARKALPALDAGAVAEAVGAARETAPDSALHAGRWLGKKLGADQDPALKLGADAHLLAFKSVCEHATVDPLRPAIVVLRGDAAGAAEATLRSVERHFSRTDAGGCAIFAIAPDARTQPRPATLRFYGGRLMRDSCADGDGTTTSDPAELGVSFGERWRISPDLSKLPESASPGETVLLPLSVVAAGDLRASERAHVFVHFVRNGKIVAQGHTDIFGYTALVPADAPQPGRATVAIAIPKGLPPGPAEVELCVKKAGALLRLKPQGGGVELNGRRVVLREIQIR